MHEELVQRLRSIAEDRLLDSDSVHGPLMQAADLIQAQAQEITRLLATRRWNIERDGAALLICEESHDRHQGCTMQRWIQADDGSTDDQGQGNGQT